MSGEVRIKNKGNMVELSVYVSHNSRICDRVKVTLLIELDRLCGLVVRVLGYRSGGSGSIPGTTRRKKVVGLERGPLSLVSTTEELLDRK
jgi:hypothetical protein